MNIERFFFYEYFKNLFLKSVVISLCCKLNFISLMKVICLDRIYVCVWKWIMDYFYVKVKFKCKYYLNFVWNIEFLMYFFLIIFKYIILFSVKINKLLMNLFFFENYLRIFWDLLILNSDNGLYGFYIGFLGLFCKWYICNIVFFVVILCIVER